MKKIVFHQREMYMMYAFALHQKYNLKPFRIVTDYYEYPALKGDGITLIFKQDGYLDNMDYLKTVDIFVTDLYSMYDENGDRPSGSQKVYECMDNTNLKVLLVDAEGEGIIHFTQFRNFGKFKKELIEKENLYLVSQRSFLQNVPNKIIGGHPYLSLLFYFYHLSDNLFLQPPLPNFSIKEKPYDFISYLGLSTDYKLKSHWRANILSKINFNDKKLHTPTSYNDRTQVQSDVEDVVDWPRGNFGSYNWFSLIESEQAKIKIVFETESPDEVEDDIYSFLTEKTMKCFLHNQPYFIFHKKIHREYLKDLGFKFEGPDNWLSLCNYISTISQGDLDDWIKKTQTTFDHNKKLMRELLYQNELPHINLLENIINET